MTDLEDSLSSQVLKMEEHKISLLKKCQDLEKVINEKNNIIMRLKTELKLEKFKLNVISKVSNINPDEIFLDKEDGVHVYNYDGGNIPIIVHDALESKHYTIKVKKQATGQIFRTVKNKMDLIEEKPQEHEEKIKKIDEDMDEIIKNNNLDISYTDTIKIIESSLENITNNRIFKKDLNIIKETRSKLLSVMGLNQYTKLTQTHINRLKGILATKKLDVKKINEYVEKFLSPLDMRLTSFGQYCTTTINIDDLQKIKISIEINTEHAKRYIPLAYDEMYIKFHTYSMALFSLKDNIKMILVNPYGFSNICFLDLENTVDDDPFRFYILDKIGSDGIRCWKLDARLDDFSRLLSQHIRIYSVQLFRKIYFDAFSDNVFRKDYKEKVLIGQYDLEQLLLNIINLSKPKSFCNIVRKIIQKFCIIQPTNLDKFNLTSDDKISKKNFMQEKDTDENIITTLKSLFDNISSNDTLELLKLY